MDYVKNQYGRNYAPNTREIFRRQVLHQFVQARIADYNPENEKLPTNSPLAHYAVTKEALSAIKSYGTDKWKKEAQKFIKKQGSLSSKYEKIRSFKMISVTLNDGKKLKLSPGKHNEVQAAVINEFAPRFSPGATVLYFGDTANKKLFMDDAGLRSIGIEITDHDKLPDAVIYDKNRNWLFLIEVVTSHGPMTPKRVFELEKLFESCPAGKVYVSAFPDFSEFRKHTKEIAWDTEVWMAEIPDHIIHYNGDRFLGPR